MDFSLLQCSVLKSICCVSFNDYRLCFLLGTEQVTGQATSSVDLSESEEATSFKDSVEGNENN